MLYFPEVIDEVVASVPPLILYFSRERKKFSITKSRSMNYINL